MPGNGYLAQRAEQHERDYITPEDVQDAVNAGVPQVALWGELIAILAKQRGLGAEDSSLCCFNALRYEDDREPIAVDWGTFSGEPAPNCMCGATMDPAPDDAKPGAWRWRCLQCKTTYVWASSQDSQ